jgi:hypothetical protein
MGIIAVFYSSFVTPGLRILVMELPVGFKGPWCNALEVQH